MIEFDGLSLHQDPSGLRNQRPHTHTNHDGNKNRTYGVRDHPPEQVHQDRRDDHAHAPQGVGQDVEKDALHDGLVGPAMTMTVVVTVSVTAAMAMPMATPTGSVVKDENTHQVDQEPEDGDR